MDLFRSSGRCGSGSRPGRLALRMDGELQRGVCVGGVFGLPCDGHDHGHSRGGGPRAGQHLRPPPSLRCREPRDRPTLFRRLQGRRRHRARPTHDHQGRNYRLRPSVRSAGLSPRRGSGGPNHVRGPHRQRLAHRVAHDAPALRGGHQGRSQSRFSRHRRDALAQAGATRRYAVRAHDRHRVHPLPQQARSRHPALAPRDAQSARRARGDHQGDEPAGSRDISTLGGLESAPKRRQAVSG